MHGQPVSYRDGEARLTGFFAWEDGRDDRRPGILVVHGGAGAVRLIDRSMKSSGKRGLQA